jgi:hypothetical protein
VSLNSLENTSLTPTDTSNLSLHCCPHHQKSHPYPYLACLHLHLHHSHSLCLHPHLHRCYRGLSSTMPSPMETASSGLPLSAPQLPAIVAPVSGPILEPGSSRPAVPIIPAAPPMATCYRYDVTTVHTVQRYTVLIVQTTYWPQPTEMVLAFENCRSHQLESG